MHQVFIILKRLQSLIESYLSHTEKYETSVIFINLKHNIASISDLEAYGEKLKAADISLELINDYYCQTEATNLDFIIESISAERLMKKENQSIETYNLRNKVLSAFEDYRYNIDDLNNELYDHMTKKSIEVLVNFIFQKHPVCRFDNMILGYVIPQVDHELKVILTNLLQKNINNLLNVTPIELSNLDSAQLSMCRYTPTESTELKVLFGNHGWDYDENMTIEENCEKAPSSIILLRRGSKSPLEFSIRSLIDENYITAESLNVPPTNRLSVPIIRRFETIRDLGVSITTPSMPTFYNKNNKIVIFETINGILWRELLNADNPLIMKRRCENYNKIMEEKILSRCFDSKGVFYVDMYVDRNVPKISTEVTKERIIKEMIPYLTTLVPQAPTIENVKKIYIDKTHLTQIMIGVISKLYNFTPANINTEYSVTFLVKFEATFRRVSTAIDKNLIKFKLKDRSFKELSKYDLHNRILDELIKVLELSLIEMDKNMEWSEMDDSFKLFVDMQNK